MERMQPKIMASGYQRTREMTLDELMLENRVIFLIGEINQASAARVMMQILYLEDQKCGQQINLYINSPGGSVDSGFAIWDQIKMIKAPVYTLVTGLAASMGSILSLCAEKSKRFATKNARIMIHQPLIAGVIQGQATDLEIQAKEIEKTRAALVHLSR